jgi:hypothetical protein
MKKILTFKHWQLFLLIFICGAWTSPGPLVEIVKSIAVVTFTLWIYAIGVYGQKRIAALGLKPMNLKLFKINTVIVSSFFLIGLAYLAIYGEVNHTRTNTFELKDIVYIPCQLYFAFAMVQPILFICKMIAKIEYKREVTFFDCINNFLLLFFFFIGVWFLQPKVNNLIARKEDVNNS